MELNANFTTKGALEAALNAKVRVELHLRGGQSVAGSVVGVSDHFAIIGKLAGKDFYDAHVRLDDISAIMVQTRTK